MKSNKRSYRKEVSIFLEMIYWLFQNEMKKGISKDEVFKKLSVGKSAKKAKTFQQTALKFGK
jgi:hypothetical protein